MIELGVGPKGCTRWVVRRLAPGAVSGIAQGLLFLDFDNALHGLRTCRLPLNNMVLVLVAEYACQSLEDLVLEIADEVVTKTSTDTLTAETTNTEGDSDASHPMNDTTADLYGHAVTILARSATDLDGLDD